MDPSEIKDKDSLEAWLENQTREVAISVGIRALMRMAPSAWQYLVLENLALERLALLSLHNLATGMVLAKPSDSFGEASGRPKQRIGDASDEAHRLVESRSGNLAASTCTIFFAALHFIALASVGRDTAKNTASAVGNASAAPNSVRFGVHDVTDILSVENIYDIGDFFAELRRDAHAVAAGLELWATTLWPSHYEGPDKAWSTSRELWLATNDPGWQFWIDWYDAALEGRPLLGDWDRHWALLTDIALIDPEVWDKGPDAVNPVVAGIVETHRALANVIAKTPNGEIIGLDPETDALTAVPVPGIDGDLRDHITSSIEKAVTRFNAACDTGGASGNFGPTLHACADQDLAYLLQDITEAGAFDLTLHDAIDDCLGSLRRKFAEQGLSADPAVARLMGVLERCTIDIYANSAPAREALEKRGEEYYRRISIEHHAQLTQLAQDMAADSVEALRRQMLADLARADDDTADPDQRRRARYRTISRLPRGAEAMRYSRYVDGRRIPEGRQPPKESKLWVATVLGPSFAELLRRFLGG